MKDEGSIRDGKDQEAMKKDQEKGRVEQFQIEKYRYKIWKSTLGLFLFFFYIQSIGIRIW